MFHMHDHLRDQKQILADSTIAAMQHARTPGDTAHAYGLGWGLDDDHGYRKVQHTGGMPGVATVLDLYPSQDLAVVVLGNQSNPSPFIIASRIENVLLPGRAEAIVAERATQQGSRSRAFAAPGDLVGDWTGTVHAYDRTLPIAVRVKSDEVLVKLGAGNDALWTLLNRPRYDNQILEGQFVGNVPTEDAMRYQHNLVLSLRTRTASSAASLHPSPRIVPSAARYRRTLSYRSNSGCGRGTRDADEGRGTRDEGRGTRDEGRGTRDEGRGTRDEGDDE